MKEPFSSKDWWNNRAFALNHQQVIEKPNGTGDAFSYQSQFAESYLFYLEDADIHLVIEVPKSSRFYRFMFFKNSVENIVLRSDCIYKNKKRACDAAICSAIQAGLLPQSYLQALYNKHEHMNPIYQLNKSPH